MVITGERGAGKTTLCHQLITQFIRRGIMASGIYCPAVFEGGEKTKIMAVDLATQDEYIFATAAPKNQPLLPGQRRLRWNFDRNVIDWGNEIFAEAVPTQLLVVDEIGPLELERGEGWIKAVDALDSREYDLAILVMRPELLQQALERWHWGRVIEVNTVDQVPGLVKQILGRFFA